MQGGSSFELLIVNNIRIMSIDHSSIFEQKIKLELERLTSAFTKKLLISIYPEDEKHILYNTIILRNIIRKAYKKVYVYNSVCVNLTEKNMASSCNMPRAQSSNIGKQKSIIFYLRLANIYGYVEKKQTFGLFQSFIFIFPMRVCERERE